MKIDFDDIEHHANFLYGNDDLVVLIAPQPFVPGELQIFPRKHYTILEQVPNPLVGKLFHVANTLSTVLFENLNCQGTNILVKNGLPAGQSVSRFSVHVLPRRENDGVNLQWPPQQFSDDQLATAKLKLEAFTKSLVLGEEKKPEVIEVDDTSPEKPRLPEKDNYQMRFFRRIP